MGVSACCFLWSATVFLRPVYFCNCGIRVVLSCSTNFEHCSMRSCLKFRYLGFLLICAEFAGFFLAVLNGLQSLCNFHFLWG
jgi:hypothetical protein